MQIKDEAGKFRHDNFRAMHESFKAATEKAPKEEGGRASGRWGNQRGRGRGRGGRGRGGGPQMAGRRDQGDITADISKILKMIKQRSLEPVIIFSFARRYSPTAAFPPLIAVARQSKRTEVKNAWMSMQFGIYSQCVSLAAWDGMRHCLYRFHECAYVARPWHAQR